MRIISNAGILLLLQVLGSISCATKTDEFFFKEAGVLLWVNANMADSLIKIGVRETLQNSSIIVSQISWSPIDRNFIKNVKWYHSLAREGGKRLMLNIDWQENNRFGTRGGWSFEDEKIVLQFSKDIKQLVELYNPNFLTLGVEVNYYALTSPSGYKSFIKMFNQLKSTLKQENPQLKIGLSFQLELLYGVHRDWHRKRALEPLEAVVENLDYIGVSTYPDVLIEKANRPFYSADYLDSIKLAFHQPLGISETGLSSIKFSNNDRSKYLKYVYKKVEDLDLKFIIWGSLIDDDKLDDWRNNLGLISNNGVFKPEFDIWKDQNNKMLKN